MAEGMREAAPGWARHHGDLFLDFRQRAEDFRPLLRVKFRVQTEIKQTELQLTQNKQRRLVVFRRQHFIQQFLRQRFAGFIMAGDKRQRLWLPAPVFHKLARQFDRIPWHTVDTGNARGFDTGQHMVQTVAELVEQGNHFIVGKQSGFAVHRTVKVTGQVGDRFLQRAVTFTHLADAVIHPRPAAFMFTGIQVEVEAAAQLVVFVIQLEETNFRMPDVNIGALFGNDAINTFNHFKQTVNGFVLREIRTQLLVADTVEMLFLFLAVVSDIPRLQLINAKFRIREGAQLSQLFLPLRTGAFRQIGQEVEDLLRVFRHFGRQRFKGVAFKAQQLCQFVAQREDLFHYRAVIPFASVRPLVRRAGGVSAIHLFTQSLVVTVGHHRQVAWDIQR